MAETRDEWLDAGAEVNHLAAGVAHHHATDHPGGGGGFDYECLECPFAIVDGVVEAGGLIRVADDRGTE